MKKIILVLVLTFVSMLLSERTIIASEYCDENRQHCTGLERSRYCDKDGISCNKTSDGRDGEEECRGKGGECVDPYERRSPAENDQEEKGLPERASYFTGLAYCFNPAVREGVTIELSTSEGVIRVTHRNTNERPVAIQSVATVKCSNGINAETPMKEFFLNSKQKTTWEIFPTYCPSKMNKMCAEIRIRVR